MNSVVYTSATGDHKDTIGKNIDAGVAAFYLSNLVAVLPSTPVAPVSMGSNRALPFGAPGLLDPKEFIERLILRIQGGGFVEGNRFISKVEIDYLIAIISSSNLLDYRQQFPKTADGYLNRPRADDPVTDVRVVLEAFSRFSNDLVIYLENILFFGEFGGLYIKPETRESFKNGTNPSGAFTPKFELLTDGLNITSIHFNHIKAEISPLEKKTLEVLSSNPQAAIETPEFHQLSHIAEYLPEPSLESIARALLAAQAINRIARQTDDKYIHTWVYRLKGQIEASGEKISLPPPKKSVDGIAQARNNLARGRSGPRGQWANWPALIKSVLARLGPYNYSLVRGTLLNGIDCSEMPDQSRLAWDLLAGDLYRLNMHDKKAAKQPIEVFLENLDLLPPKPQWINPLTQAHRQKSIPVMLKVRKNLVQEVKIAHETLIALIDEISKNFLDQYAHLREALFQDTCWEGMAVPQPTIDLAIFDDVLRLSTLHRNPNGELPFQVYLDNWMAVLQREDLPSQAGLKPSTSPH